MTVLLIIFLVFSIILASVHILSAVQLYKQHSLGPVAIPSVVAITAVWLVMFVSVWVNFMQYFSAHS
ncbi:hypothetical protein KA517_02485 [Candidatus Gracilibacteria bacterium]|nr:hypothetical protein [Candidatus Gracilibacteria bacterium]MBP7057483.1 hypothetical protein [Candidatus Gracilibacteria bacterium]